MKEHVPESASCNEQQRKAQQKDQNAFAPFAVLQKRSRIGKHAIDPHRVGDVLDMAVTERFVSANQLMLYLLIDAAGDKDFAGMGYAFKPRGNIDAVAVNVVHFDDDIAEVDANSILDPMVLRQRSVASHQILLNHDAAADGLDGAVENRNEPIAGGFNKPAVMFCDAGLNEIALDALDTVVRAFFVDLHQTAVTGDIACHDGRKAARYWFAWWCANSACLDVANLGHGSDCSKSCKQQREANNLSSALSVPYCLWAASNPARVPLWVSAQ